MKRTLIAAAIAAGLVGAAQAETTLYGTVGMSLNYNDKYATAAEQDKANWDIKEESTKFGIKGSEDLGNGLVAAYQFEFKVGINKGGKQGISETRKAWVGLVGDFGTVAIGRQQLPYYNVMSYNDIFNAQFSYDGYYILGLNRISDALAYVTPNYDGFQIQAAAVIDGDASAGNNVLGANTRDIDAFNISAIYDNAGLFAGLSYLQLRLKDKGPDVKDPKFWGAVVGYKNEAFQIGLAGEYAPDAGVNAKGESKDLYEVNLAGEYYFGDNTLRGAIAYVNNKATDVDGMFYALGYQYNFSERTSTWIETAYYDNDNKKGNAFTTALGDGAAVDPNMDGFTVSVGLRHDF